MAKTREEWLKQGEELLNEAQEAGNLNAAASFWEKIGKAEGYIKEHIVTEVVYTEMDRELLSIECYMRELLAATSDTQFVTEVQGSPDQKAIAGERLAGVCSDSGESSAEEQPEKPCIVSGD